MSFCKTLIHIINNIAIAGAYLHLVFELDMCQENKSGLFPMLITLLWYSSDQLLQIYPNEKPGRSPLERSHWIQSVYEVVTIPWFPQRWTEHKIQSLVDIFFHYCRICVEEQPKICEDLFWYSNIWQNHQRQSSKVCQYVVSNWWHYGTPHWVFHHKCSGDCLLCI